MAIKDKDHQLVAELQEKSKRTAKLISSSTYSAPAIPEMTIRSWKLNEFKFYDVPSPFPTLARGLFTTWIPDNASSKEGDDLGRYRIVARGYDKFFNIGEVPWTTWPAIETNTNGPYVLTLKSNGCIIFIAAISSEKLVITSKHSLGPVKGSPISHAEMGEQWLHRHLKSKGRTPEQFAKVLWDNRWTAVAELCDDSFEEHVLPYGKDKTGLHLHGINKSIGAFNTLPSDVVNKFANEWGFIETLFHTEQTVEGVQAFAKEVEKSKMWNGEAIEGFVVRCHISSNAHKDRRTAPPYPEGSSFFFKIKYDEPYMMYRDWREVSKMLLTAATKGGVDNASLPKNKLRRPETKLYVDWMKKEIKRDAKQFEDFKKGKGIIATRERFLAWLETKQGKEASASALADQLAAAKLDEQGGPKFTKTIIAPIAVPGVGKTMTAVALKYLFGFGHVQSDDIKAKKPAPLFLKKVKEELAKHDVVIADKNNHLKRHRDDLRGIISDLNQPIRLLALHWSLDLPPASIHRICCDRIIQRGDKHQSLVPDAVEKKHEEVLWMFLNQTEALGDKEVDDSVDMAIHDDFEHNLDRAIDACVRILGLPKPSQQKIGEAMAAARGYNPSTYKKDEPQAGRKEKKSAPRYYGLLPEVNVADVIEARLVNDDAPAATKAFFKSLKDSKRVTNVPHITLVHNKSLPGEQELWDRCKALGVNSESPLFRFRITHLIHNDRVMALVIGDLSAASGSDEEASPAAAEFVTKLADKVKNVLHVTVGTKEASILPYEARGLVESWRQGKAPSSVKVIALDVQAKGQIKGLFS